jgi:hypothetical protein
VPPWLLLLTLVALVIALTYQLATRRYGWRLLFYWALILLALAGFEAVAESVGWNITRFGDLRVAPDLVGAGLVVAAFRLLGI